MIAFAARNRLLDPALDQRRQPGRSTKKHRMMLTQRLSAATLGRPSYNVAVSNKRNSRPVSGHEGKALVSPAATGEGASDAHKSTRVDGARTAQRVEPADLRRVLGQFATGVTIVTARGVDGAPVGLTVNSFASVSLDPPLVLWSVARTAASFAAFRSCRGFRVHVLAADQLALAQKFAVRGGDKFDRSPVGDLPIIDGGVAWFECDNREQYDEGDHVILIGRVTAFGSTGSTPLVFHDGRYMTEIVEKLLPAGWLP